MSSYREAVTCLVGFEGYLKDRKPDAVFALHENNFWVRILFYLAQKNSITTYSLQEGIILEREEEILKKYSTGTQYTDVLFSWSKYDKNFYADTSKIVPVGPSHMDGIVVALKQETSRNGLKNELRKQAGMSHKGSVVVFAPPRLDLYAGDFFRAVDSLAKWTMNRNIGLVVKLHPFQGGIEQIKSVLARYAHVLVANDADSLQFIALADVLITQTSTISVEAAILGIPVIELDMDYVGLEQTIHQHGGATLLEGDNLDEILDVMKAEKKTDFVDEFFSLADGQSTKRIVDYVMAGLWVK
jgi:CDP-glycerol glycerophosphotransferase (TagB/SpsB family)